MRLNTFFLSLVHRVTPDNSVPHATSLILLSRLLIQKKNETILDPACGTAGFLISSYKHILRANTDAKGQSTLTPDEKGQLAQNFKGYDISPDMVRLSLVNLYLHGFTDPHIDEYDTLTSEDKWNEFRGGYSCQSAVHVPERRY